MYNGQGCNLSKLTVLSAAKSYSISAENVTGDKGAGAMATEGNPAARDLGQGWKMAPSVYIEPGTEYVMADITGEGIIRHIWLTLHHRHWRSVLIKMYWEGEEAPAVCTPIGDFFCCGWCTPLQINSLAVTVNTRGGFNSYFEMPFRRHAKIVVENLSTEVVNLYYQIDFARTTIDPDSVYFHACWNRQNPVPYKEEYTILHTIRGRGHYIGTYMAWQANSNGWWGEGEIKFYLDGDTQFPTICGTGTEDYFGGAWCFEVDRQYIPFSTPYQGFDMAYKPDGFYKSNPRFSMYRWHLSDPITFENDLRVTIQALGWRSGKRFLPLQDDLASVAYWYQDSPAGQANFNYTVDDLEVI